MGWVRIKVLGIIKVGRPLQTHFHIEVGLPWEDESENFNIPKSHIKNHEDYQVGDKDIIMFVTEEIAQELDLFQYEV